MKAMQYVGYGDPRQLRLADVPVPQPAPQELLVRVITCQQSRQIRMIQIDPTAVSDIASTLSILGPSMSTTSNRNPA